VRRIVGLILAGLGAFFLVLALLLRFYVPGQVIKFPLNEYQIAVLHDNNASYFSVAKLRLLSNVSVTATNTVRGDVTAGNSSTAVWDEFTAVRDDTNNVVFNYTLLRGPFDRRTGVFTNCCGAALNGKPGHLSGQGFVWPFGAQQKTYMVFDTTLARPMPATYAGTATIDGLRTYRYVEQVSPSQSGTQTLPGVLVGMKSQPSVTLPEYYQATNTYWVDPVSGAPVDSEQNQTLTLRDSSGATRLLLFQADLKFTPHSIKSYVDTAANGKNKITLITFTLPLILLLLGVILLAVGTVLAVLPGRTSGEPATEGGFQPQDQGLAPH
jgi:hypothetical protein